MSALGESTAVRLDRIEHRLDSLDKIVSLKTFLLGPRQNGHFSISDVFAAVIIYRSLLGRLLLR